MIIVAGQRVMIAEIQPQLPSGRVERQVLAAMDKSEFVYHYDSLTLLEFELIIRNNIVDAALGLYQSGAAFATFDTSRCNPAYWTLTENGGFLLKEGVQPAKAINDIFDNGRVYAFECAVAMVIVYYKAVIATIGENAFNRHFHGLFLRSWLTDSDLVLITRDAVDALAGDVRYFKNPDVNPRTPQWQGENAVDLGNGTYFGHGLGIITAEQIIFALNRFRRPGATRSAYLLKQATRPHIQSLARLSDSFAIRQAISKHGDQAIVIRIGGLERRIG